MKLYGHLLATLILPSCKRTLADWTVRPALLRVQGVSEVLVMGGELREWQINVNAEQTKRYDIRIEDIEMKVRTALANKSGGVLVQGGKEYPLRILVAPQEISNIRELALGMHGGRPFRVADIASVVEGPNPVRGSATINGQSGAVLRVVKQPDAETLKVSAALDEVITSLRPSLPQGVTLQNDLFRQEWFIHAGLRSVLEALRDGTLLVIIILMLFLMNIRTTAITLTALPLVFLSPLLCFVLQDFL